MMKLNRYFDREEFECSCKCGFNTVDAELLSVLTSVRTYFNQPVHINSATRCFKHNAEVGGKPTSQHLIGRAADITVSNVSNEEVQAYLLRMNGDRFGIGCYDTFTHIDTLSSKARW